ncbi:hypothetical protein KF707_18990 [Candidatus Obscuribacterales bacterium]|nr:hypothetical protein [Candidatus Obscuribacterales bacterium]
MSEIRQKTTESRAASVWQQQIVELLRSVMGKLDGFSAASEFRFDTIQAGTGESIETVCVKCPQTFGLDTDMELKSRLPKNTVHFFGHRSPDWNPFGRNTGSFDLLVAQGTGFQGVLRAAQTHVESCAWDTERLIKELESIGGVEIDVLFAEPDFIAADFICTGSDFQHVAHELKRICPELYVGTGFKPNALSLATLLEQDEAHISMTWAETNSEQNTEDKLACTSETAHSTENASAHSTEGKSAQWADESR